MILKVASPAKLNLFLHIVGRRDNGYHNLQSIFQLIDLCDYLTFIPHKNNHIQVHGLHQVKQEDNLIYRACQLMRPHAQNFTGLDIYLEKNIPMGAGLGGGSSNAATTLLTLNHLWQCHLTIEHLANYAQQLGADVPFFVYGQNAWVEGIGEIITPITLPKSNYILLKPDCFISTQTLFQQQELVRNSKISTIDEYFSQAQQFINNFENVAKQLYPEVQHALDYLSQYGQAKLTGTGSCVFVEIDKTSIDSQTILNHAPCRGYITQSLNISPVHDYLANIEK